ncbi:hypothetical protein DFJ74DRAFT_703807 [Hyaloraphidium curvatum]|nr:hypothetical protein DFJ74DRAFT_703807 [Hyaloraphidium curvatum]
MAPPVQTDDSPPAAPAVPPADLAVVDLASFDRSAPHRSQALADLLVSTMRDVGFAYVVNHGIPGDRVKWAFDTAKGLFEERQDEKDSYIMGPDYIGYCAVGKQVLDPSGIPDKKEMWNLAKFGKQHPGYDRGHPDYLAKRWTELEDFSRRCHTLSLDILRLLSLGLRIPSATTEGAFDPDYLPNFHAYDAPSGDTLRFVRYPAPRPEWTPEEAGVRIGAHTDFGSVSLVFSDPTGGLQILDPRSGSWRDVPPVQGAVIINLGDCLQFWTGSGLRSTLHRVVPSPIPGMAGKERLAVAYFCRPGFETPLDPIPSPLLGDGRGETADPAAPEARRVTAGEWLRARVAKSVATAGAMPNGY